MPSRRVQKTPLKIVPKGDMRHRIGLYSRAITSPAFNSTSFTEPLTLICNRWAALETLQPGRKQFSEVQIDEGAESTHLFKINYLSTVTKEVIIKFRDEYYEIKKVIDPEERKQFMFLYSIIKGSTDKEANQ